MASNNKARLTSQQMFRYAPQSSVLGGTFQKVGFGTCSGNGAADGTTIVDASGAALSTGADAYNGKYWVRMKTGNNKGEMKRVVDDNGSGTLTLENNGFTDQVASGDEYEIWLAPDAGVVVVDSSSGETNMVDATRTEANVDGVGFWVDYYAIPITGTHRGKLAKVTAFVPGTGTFTLESSFGSALSAGDVVLLRKYLEVNMSPSTEEAYHARIMNRVNFSKGDGVVGAKQGSISFEAHPAASGSLATSGNTANGCTASGLMQACGLVEKINTSVQAQAGSTTTTINIATATQENIKIGSVVIHKGNARRVTSKTDGGVGDDTLTVSPALPTAPAASDDINATRMYEKETDGDFYGAVCEWEVDGIRHTFFGCKGNIEFVDGSPAIWRFTFSFEHYVREKEAAPENPVSAYTTTGFVLGKDKLVWLDTSQVDISGFTSTPGAEVVRREVSGRFGMNGTAGIQMVNIGGGGTFQQLLESDGDLDSEEIWHERTAKALLAVWDSHGRAIAITMPVARLMAAPHPADQGGLQGVPNQYEAQDAGTFSDPTDGVVKIADWALHIA